MPPAEQNELNKALVKFQAKLKGAKKDSSATIPTKGGGSYGYSYADLESVWQAAVDAGLAECGLSISQDVGYHYCGYGQDGEIIDTLTTELRHESGQMKSGTMRLFPSSTPQAQGSAITYARRYAMAAILGIHQADDDAQEAESNRPKQQSKAGNSGASPLPTCPECGMLNLRPDRNKPDNYYCWLKSDPPGCGYKGPKAAETFSDKKEAAERRQLEDMVTKEELQHALQIIQELGFEPAAIKEYIYEEFAMEGVRPDTVFTHYTHDMMKKTEAYFVDKAQTQQFMHATSEEIPF